MARWCLMAAVAAVLGCGGLPKEDSPLPDGRPALIEALVAADEGHGRVTWVGESITEQAQSGLGFTTYIERAYPGAVYSNQGLGGSTTLSTLARLDTILETEGGLYVLAIGMNDARYNDSRGATTVEAYLANMRQLVNGLRSRGAQVVVVSMWPTFSRDQFAALGREATDRRMVEWNEAVHRMCAEELGVPFVDAYPRVVQAVAQLGEDALVPDGVHPDWNGSTFVGTAGRELYARSILGH
jgi:lysophospholipase L1-like esterase